MALLRLTYSGNIYDAAPAGTVDFPLVTKAGQNIPYLQKAHIHAYRSTDKGLTWTELTKPTDWDFDSTGTIVRLKTGLSLGDWIRVQRITPYQDLYTTFQDSSLLTAEQLNEGEKFSMYVDQELTDLSGGNWNGTTDTITIADQKRPDSTGLKSAGWIADDNHIATTGAISERLDPFVQDTRPADPPISEYRQAGKIWIDDGALQQSFWEPTARAWVNLGSSGPQGPAGTIAVGSTNTVAAGQPALVTNVGTATAAIFNFNIPQGPTGLPGSTGPAGPPGGAMTHAASPPITVSVVGTTVTYGFDITTLATLA